MVFRRADAQGLGPDVPFTHRRTTHGGKEDDVRARQGKASGGFWKHEVVTDEHADGTKFGSGKHGKRLSTLP